MTAETSYKEKPPKERPPLPVELARRLRQCKPQIEEIIKGVRKPSMDSYHQLAKDIFALEPLALSPSVQSEVHALAAAIERYATLKEQMTASYMKTGIGADISEASDLLQAAGQEALKIAKMPILAQFWWD
jgi:hypothetical protein